MKFIGRIPEYLEEFQDDVFSMTQFMQYLSPCVEGMNRGIRLEDMCKALRARMMDCKCRTNGKPLEVGVRKCDLLGNKDDIIGKMSSKAETVKEDFEKLGIQFQDALSEENEIDFIKKCADFHFDFTRVHPFTDANGRTARILLSMMLATKNYMFPSLYSTMYEKSELYTRSNTALEGDYSTIEEEVFDRLGHFQPLVKPKFEHKHQPVTNQNKIGIDGIESIGNDVTAKERVEGIAGLKRLRQRIQQNENQK